MRLGARHLLLRCFVVWLVVTAIAVLTAWAARCALTDALASSPAPSLERALVTTAWCAVAACAGWVWLTTTVTVAVAVHDLRRGRLPRRPPTGPVRRWVLLACGVAAVTIPAAPALAGAHHHDGAVTLPYPDRAVAPVRSRPSVVGSGDPPSSTVTVHPGDSLWTIARRDLGASASDADMTARWHVLYAANRPEIGPDPDLIRPGQRLLLPGRRRT